MLPSKGLLPDTLQSQNYDMGYWVGPQKTEGTTQICLPDLESGQVLRIRENEAACGSAGGASFDQRVLELCQL